MSTRDDPVFRDAVVAEATRLALEDEPEADAFKAIAACDEAFLAYYDAHTDADGPATAEVVAAFVLDNCGDCGLFDIGLK